MSKRLMSGSLVWAFVVGLAACSSSSSGSGIKVTYVCAESDPTAQTDCNTCTAANCAAESTAEVGPDWRSGIISGPCEATVSCLARCACGDFSCFDACAKTSETDDCRAAAEATSECTDKNCPSCSSTTTSSADAGRSD